MFGTEFSTISFFIKTIGIIPINETTKVANQITGGFTRIDFPSRKRTNLSASKPIKIRRVSIERLMG